MSQKWKHVFDLLTRPTTRPEPKPRISPSTRVCKKHENDQKRDLKPNNELYLKLNHKWYQGQESVRKWDLKLKFDLGLELNMT